jgi:hypothetical protein
MDIGSKLRERQGRRPSTGLDVWQVVRRDGGQVDGKWMADA